MINLTEYGYTQAFSDIDTGEYIPARVMAVHKERYDIICEHGETHATLKAAVYLNGGDEYFPTTGDFVLIDYNPIGDSRIVKTLERKSFFSRRDPTPGRGEQAVAANFDYVFILQSLNFDFNMKRLERYLTLGWQSGAVPVIILTKADLVEDFTPQISEIERIAVGVGVYAVSAKTGYGLQEIFEYIKPGKTAVLLGSSGVGKSSLLNALSDDEVMLVNTIREDDSKGRHTTTHRQLVRLENGMMIIDTPGMRELGMWDVTVGLGEAFSDIDEYVGKCRFSDCKHKTEPGCAILEAIANGDITQERFQSYLKLKREAKYSDSKAARAQSKQQLNKGITKENRQKKKASYFGASENQW